MVLQGCMDEVTWVQIFTVAFPKYSNLQIIFTVIYLVKLILYLS